LLIFADFDLERCAHFNLLSFNADKLPVLPLLRTPKCTTTLPPANLHSEVRNLIIGENFNDLLQNVEICNRIQAYYLHGPVQVQKVIMTPFHSNANTLSQVAMDK